MNNRSRGWRGQDTSTRGTEAVTGLTVLAIEVLPVPAGDGAPGSLQAEDRDTDVVIKAKRSRLPSPICNNYGTSRRPVVWQSFKAGDIVLYPFFFPFPMPILLPCAYNDVCVLLQASWTFFFIVRLAGTSPLHSAPYPPGVFKSILLTKLLT